MINFTTGNIFESQARVLVNPVNCVGVMGKGLAKQFRDRYPNVFERYQDACASSLLTPGKLMLVHASDHDILLFPTKVHWRDPSRIEYIEDGLKKFVAAYAEKKIESVAFPKLGCGCGGLDWSEVKQLMTKYLDPLPITIYVYE